MYCQYCRKHHQKASPIYHRPDGKSFIRVPKLLYCPGTDGDGHVLQETGIYACEEYQPPPNP